MVWRETASPVGGEPEPVRAGLDRGSKTEVVGYLFLFGYNGYIEVKYPNETFFFLDSFKC